MVFPVAENGPASPPVILLQAPQNDPTTLPDVMPADRRAAYVSRRLFLLQQAPLLQHSQKVFLPRQEPQNAPPGCYLCWSRNRRILLDAFLLFMEPQNAPVPPTLPNAISAASGATDLSRMLPLLHNALQNAPATLPDGVSVAACSCNAPSYSFYCCRSHRTLWQRSQM